LAATRPARSSEYWRSVLDSVSLSSVDWSTSPACFLSASAAAPAGAAGCAPGAGAGAGASGAAGLLVPGEVSGCAWAATLVRSPHASARAAPFQFADVMFIGA